MASTNILFICPYPYDEAPSQRFRFEQYLPELNKVGYHYKLAPFLNKKSWDILYKSGNIFQKLYWLIISFLKRIILLFQLQPYEYIFIHREATPVGPPLFEWAVKFIWKKKIIYDFDDAIWLDDPTEKGSLKAFVKFKSKVKSICNWSYRISCGNEYLANFAKQFNANVNIIPTTIDTDYHKELDRKQSSKNTIGWTGTHSTIPYLKLILPILDQLNREYDFELLVISNQKPDFNVSYMRFMSWQKSSEIEDLNQIDIGIMPLTDDIWSHGKCGFKLLQYMAIRKPVVASPIGVNKKILNESQAGFSAVNDREWRVGLEKLLVSLSLRTELGTKGTQYVEEKYSIKSNKSIFLGLFQ